MHQSIEKLYASIIVLASVLAGCTNKRHDCVARADCPPLTSIADGGTDNGGAASTQNTNGSYASGSGGDSVLGGTGGSATETSQGIAGASPGSSSMPCGGKCNGRTPACDVTSNTCVECTDGVSHCSADAPVCNSKNVCVQCESSSSCETDGLVCDSMESSPTLNTCVECVANTDCKTAAKSRCDAASHTCVACGGEGSPDCSHIVDATVCLPGDSPETNRCVQCTGRDFTACGTFNGKPLVCDSLKNTCSTDRTTGKVKPCEACISDAECEPGLACHEQTFNDQFIGYFCFMKQGEAQSDATKLCRQSSHRPYLGTDENSTSIDGMVSDICVLRSTTCPAWIAYLSETNKCARNGLPNDADCNHEGSNDAKCVLYSPNEYRCAPRCTYADDCPAAMTETGNLCTGSVGETTCGWP